MCIMDCKAVGLVFHVPVKQASRQAGRQAGRQACRQAGRHAGRQEGKQACDVRRGAVSNIDECDR